ncbi:hypothetical protein ISG33_15760 [Glaciecola sp. MH2013]|uniref:hypothetical protein n=1 Tax=Glaciecola sp. MH2013 TaxID=2785524 RepID=UPI00189FE049|nr:hypothetical protein [Glaciecola sp. MH2013]MBF7074858.1 hypothetical protein [Glaciecola sp. MH2013]
MTDYTDLEFAADQIRKDKISIQQFAKNIDSQGKREQILEQLHNRLSDRTFISERSLYCSLIKEFNCKESLPILWEMIGRDETKGRRGSLVYAMENMNPIDYLEKLVDLAIVDNYEVLCNAIGVIDGIEGFIDQMILSNCRNKIINALAKPMPEWRRAALELLLEEFQE